MKPEAQKLQRVLVAVDFSAESRQAVRTARSLVSATGGSLTVAHVRPFSDVRAAVFEERGDLLKKKTPGLRKAMADHYGERLSGMIQEGEERSVLLRGKPALELCQEAGQNYDLLVMGSRGRGGVASMLPPRHGQPRTRRRGLDAAREHGPGSPHSLKSARHGDSRESNARGSRGKAGSKGKP